MDTPQGFNRPLWAFNQAEFKRQERICKSKCYGMKNKVVADDDIVQEACVRGLRLAQRSGRPTWKAINNQVFWRTNELCGHARRKAKSTQSIADIIGKSTPDVDDSDDWVTTSETLFPSNEAGYEDVERIDLIERIHAQISDHLVNVATMRCEGCTNKEIAAATGIPEGTVQYHWESYKRSALKALASIGITTYAQLLNHINPAA